MCLRVKEIIDEKKEDYRLIVFTKKRASALILNHVIEHINKVKSSYLLGHSSRIDAFMSEVMSLEKQRKILTEFKNGEVKILVSTSVAEEGIDIRPCNFVLMFNGLESIQSYIQTSGRARQKDSKYIVFQEKSDAEIMRIGKEVISSLPQVFKERTLDYEIPITENVSEFYEVESTKARVTLNNSSNLLNRIFGKLTKSPKEIIWEDKDGKKRAILTLPTGFPLQKKVVEGQWYVLRANATKSAALELIKRLHQENILNDHLHLKNDAPKKRIKTANYRLNREEVLVTRKIPAPLVGKWDSPSQDFFGHRICIDETVSKFGLFSLTEFEVPPFQIYLKGQKQNKITFESLHKLTLENPLLEIARKFHTSLFKMLCKGLKGDGLDPNTETYAYLILPINNDDIDWEYLQQFLEPRKIIANTLPRSQLEGKILTTLYDSLSYKVVSVHTGLQLQSPFQGGRDNSGKPFPARPANNPTIDIPNTDNFNPAPKTKSTPSNFLEHFSKKRGFEIIDTNQELVEARRLRYPKNGLRVQQKTEKKTPGIYLPPELCFVEELTTEMHDQAILLPSILIRLESLLIAHQLREACPIRADPDKILEALTPSGVAEGFNYERLENLGDTVLKYLVCLSLFVVYPDYTEGELSERKARLVSNLNLFDLASAKNLGSYSSPEKCTFQEWATSGCKANNQMKIRKKSLSDETEALIAVAYLSDEGVTKDKPILGRRLHNSAKFLEWLDLFKDMQNSLREIEDKLNNYHLEYIPNGLNLYEKEYFVSNVLKYKFRDANLLSAAFSKDSRSCLPFQRLEFIGDAALDLIVLEIMHQKFPKADPGQYTHLKHCVCSNWMFGRISWEYGFQKLGCIDNQTMEKIRVYGEAIAEYKVRMEAEIASRRTEAGFSEEEIRRKHIFQYADADPPKILGDIFESVAGAILVDSGFNLEKVKEVFDPLLRPIMSLLSPECAVFHPTILLLEKCQKEDKNFHWDSRKKDDQWTVQFFIGNELIASATCANKSSAKVKASSEALKKLRVHM
uniref:Uncharacterized protein n=1 Tax=Arcella intermedia TaxID=1963864 RepID=A0A6B2KWY7_9EUKA